jgi:hypothetical protein
MFLFSFFISLVKFINSYFDHCGAETQHLGRHPFVVSSLFEFINWTVPIMCAIKIFFWSVTHKFLRCKIIGLSEWKGDFLKSLFMSRSVSYSTARCGGGGVVPAFS